MGSRTPSHRRREGREAFEPGLDPTAFCPYRGRHWDAQASYRQDWLDGWNEAKEAYEKTLPPIRTSGEIIERLVSRLDEMENLLAQARVDIETLQEQLL